jgi:hypothetical protein
MIFGEIECGETVCAADPGHRCRYCEDRFDRATGDTLFICTLYQRELGTNVAFRCRECLKHNTEEMHDLQTQV